MNRRHHRKPPPDPTPDLFSFSPPVPSNPARASDPETSQAAAARVASPDVKRFRATSKQAKLLVEFDAAPNGLTDHEAAQRVMGANAFPTRLEGCRRRCSDLRAAGYLEAVMLNPDTQLTRRNPGSPDESGVWTITADGKIALACLLATGWSRDV
jgi:hypothetical protein